MVSVRISHSGLYASRVINKAEKVEDWGKITNRWINSEEAQKDIRKTSITSASMNIMNLVLKHTKYLNSFDLSNNHIGDYGCHLLLNNLVRNKALLTMKL